MLSRCGCDFVAMADVAQAAHANAQEQLVGLVSLISSEHPSGRHQVITSCAAPTTATKPLIHLGGHL